MTFDHLVVLMSTFNGEKFLKEQLDSIINQDFKNWTLLIRDDGSSDKTLEIINEYVHVDRRIQLFKDSLGNLGPAKSFLKMLTSVEAPFFMFADQDDIWYPSKINHTIGLYKLNNHNDEKPTLVYTNMDTVDQSGKEIQENILPDDSHVSPDSVVVTNVVTGCTMLINRSLAERVKLADADSIVMHDWWFTMIASFWGMFFIVPFRHLAIDNMITMR